MKYTLIRSRRKTLAMEIKNGELIVRAPLLTSQKKIAAFLKDHEDWINKKMTKAARQQRQAEAEGLLTADELAVLTQKAKTIIPERVDHYARQMGVNYGRVTIRHQKTRWGSCSAKGNLNFNCLLMLTPQEVIDSVVVHELCHLKEMNHSRHFFAEVYRVFPDYDRCHRWLKENGGAIMMRMG